MKLPITKLVNNLGQIDGIPRNPRQIKKDDYDKLIKSLQEDPDFLNHKPLHVYQQGDKYVVPNGNPRNNGGVPKRFLEIRKEIAPAIEATQ